MRYGNLHIWSRFTRLAKRFHSIANSFTSWTTKAMLSPASPFFVGEARHRGLRGTILRHPWPCRNPLSRHTTSFIGTWLPMRAMQPGLAPLLTLHGQGKTIQLFRKNACHTFRLHQVRFSPVKRCPKDNAAGTDCKTPVDLHRSMYSEKFTKSVRILASIKVMSY